MKWSRKKLLEIVLKTSRYYIAKIFKSITSSEVSEIRTFVSQWKLKNTYIHKSIVVLVSEKLLRVDLLLKLWRSTGPLKKISHLRYSKENICETNHSNAVFPMKRVRVLQLLLLKKSSLIFQKFFTSSNLFLQAQTQRNRGVKKSSSMRLSWKC